MRLFPVGPKIFPNPNTSSSPLNVKMGNEIRTTNDSKKNLRGYNNKFTGYMDASQLTRLRASSNVSKQMNSTDPNKFNPRNDVNDALRRNRNAGAVVPPKVTNRKMCNY
mgnify:CR=1 FL=1|jgi:hypothetical protein|tara:strand:+ start:276 stop:602 length:327 start_codon:yes stop_codon:yes gene_type:complete